MINTDISTITKIIEEYLLSFNFSKKQTKYIADNIIEAELNGKVSHGISTLLSLPVFISSKSIQIDAKPKVKMLGRYPKI